MRYECERQIGGSLVLVTEQTICSVKALDAWNPQPGCYFMLPPSRLEVFRFSVLVFVDSIPVGILHYA
jgi:hypothetical protein